MGISGVSASGYYQVQTASSQGSVPEERKALTDVLREEQDSQSDLTEVMKEARERAEEAKRKRDELLKKTRSGRR